MKNLQTQLAVLFVVTLCLLTRAYSQITPSGDSYTNTASPTTNYGSKTVLDVESASQTSYIQFDLSAIPAGYTGSNITKATLKLYVNAVTKAGSFNVDYVNGAWSESTITADLAPALGNTIAASVPLTTADKNQYINIDVTEAVQAWLNGTANDGIALVGNSPLNASFDSKENTTTSHAAELDIVFAGGGGGGITGVTAGTDLTGGGTSGNVTLNVDTTKVPQLAAANTFSANQTVNGTVTASSFSGNGSGLTNITAANSSELGGLAPGAFAQLAAANTFTANQTVNGTLNATSTGSAVVGNSTSSILAAIAGGGSQIGVYGVASSSTGSGVYGSEAATTGTAAGVYGTTSSPSGYGVYGSGGTGVYGVSSTLGGIGLEGLASDSAGGTGVVGESAGGTGIYGSTAGASGFSITQNIGIWGDTGGTPAGDYVAVLGSAGENYAAEFYNNGSDFITLYAQNNAASQSSALVFETYGGHFGGSCDINVSGDLSCTGSLVDAVPVDSGARRVAMYGMQSSENWFEDAGSGQLSTGSARITLDTTFAQTVNAGVEYHVFLTPKGDCKGLYVTNETATGFDVHELSGGKSNIAFDYRIMAKRVGYENVRLADLTEQARKGEAQRQKMHSGRPSSAPQVRTVAPAAQLKTAVRGMTGQPK